MSKDNATSVTCALGEVASSNAGGFDLVSRLRPDKIPSALPPLDAATAPLGSARPDSHARLASLAVRREPWHQLVVIGNGFDLECDLPSGFGDFIKARKDCFAKAKGSGADGEFTETLWDFILAESSDANWCDVEGAIAEWVTPKDPRRESKTPLALENRGVPFGEALSVLEELSKYGNDPAYDDKKPAHNVARRVYERFQRERKPWTKERLLTLMRDDLRVLERDFSDYLRRAIEETPSYGEKSRALMHDLLGYGLPDRDSYDIKASILSFNYTSPEVIHRVDGNPVNFVNIHGKLGGEIVFGVDGTGHMADLDALPFTKTYRLMALDVSNVGSIVRGGAPGMGIGATNLIKFYGHSLGEADYSYFQAIFDTVSLYEGRTKLVFFTKPYGDKSEDEVRYEMMGKAIALLNAYGGTLDNKDHGKNLIHKLLIEGRLQIKVL